MSNLDEKKKLVQEVKEKLVNCKSTVLADYRGLTVAEANELRNVLRKASVEYRVVKNTLTTLAAQEAGLNQLEEHLAGPTALAFGMQDPVLPAKLLSEFAKTHKNLKIKGGVVEGKVVDLAGVRALADLPPREVLLAQLLGVMQGPLSGWVNVLQAPIRQVGYVLEAVRKKQEEAAS